MVEIIPTTGVYHTFESDIDGSGGDNMLLADRRVEGSRAVRYNGDIEGRSETADCYDIDDDHGRISGEQGRQLLSASRRPSNDVNDDGGDDDDEAAACGAGDGRNGSRGTFRTTPRALRRQEKVKGFGDSGRGDEGRWGRTSACWRECLVPMQLLRERRTRNVMFVYAVFSVRPGVATLPVLPRSGWVYLLLESRHVARGSPVVSHGDPAPRSHGARVHLSEKVPVETATVLGT